MIVMFYSIRFLGPHKTLEEGECKTKAWSDLGLLYTVKNNNDKMMNKGVKRTIGCMLTRIG